MNKINIFYPFDKGFFGKSLLTPIKKAVVESKPLNLDSVDDFNHYFAKKLFRNNLERVPEVEVFTPQKNVCNDEFGIDFMKLF